MISLELEQKLKTLPKQPGVYIMHGADGGVIYVGKAKVLANRVRQYFGSSAKPAKVEAMVKNIADLEYVTVGSEVEALILEANLIKQHKPYYNILLRDDKQFPYVRINVKEDYPRLEIVRHVKNDGARYFGPFLAARNITDILETVHKLFPIRSCRKDLSKKSANARPCLNYQMGTCLGPCCGKTSPEEYGKALDGVMDLLSGKTEELERNWTKQMKEASENLEFEKAAALRDRIRILKRMGQKQTAGFPELTDCDVFGAASGEKVSVVQAFFVRNGKLSLTERYTLDSADEKEVMGSFLKQFYSSGNPVPKKIYVSVFPEDGEVIGEWLSSVRGNKVTVICPQRGSNRRLTDMAAKNAREILDRRENEEKRKYEKTTLAAESLGNLLGTGYIKRMECYDISNTQGTDSVASMVVFTDGKPDRKEYRRFRIRTVEGANDFDSMAEVMTRRLLEGFSAGDHENGFGVMPTLIVIDGGKIQLSRAKEVLDSMGLDDVGIVSLAKRDEEVCLPDREEPLVLPLNSKELRLLMAIRDEAHRFAITYHRALRTKRTLESELDAVDGIGPARKKALIEAFGDISGIRNASPEQLASVNTMTSTAARNIYRYFHENEEQEN